MNDSQNPPDEAAGTSDRQGPKVTTPPPAPPGHVALEAALRFGTALVNEGDDLTDAERRVMTRALLHELQVACREFGVLRAAAVRGGRAVRSDDDATANVTR